MENMENMEIKVEETEDMDPTVPAEEAETGKKVDVAGLAELGLMIVGGVTVAKKVIKWGFKLGDKIVTGIKAKKAAKEQAAVQIVQSPESAPVPVPTPVPSEEEEE